MKKWLLIDGFNLAFRSFYAIPELTRTDGFPTNAIHGWLRTLWYLESEQNTQDIVVFFDLEGSKRRQTIFPEYKAHRKETPEALVQQIPYLKDLSKLLGYPVIESPGLEADDLIASAALKLKAVGDVVYIVSADKDLGQIVQPNIFQLLPPSTQSPSTGWRVWDEKAVHEKLGIKPALVIDYLALIGDTSDNISGIPGVGPKTAVKWLQQWGSLENILAHATEIIPERFQDILKNSIEQLKLNQDLVRLETDLEIKNNLARQYPDRDKLFQFLEAMQMNKALADARKKYDGTLELNFSF